MDNIKKLEELKNDLKMLNNKKVFEYSKLENLYSKLETEMDELGDLLVKINEEQSINLKLGALSCIGIIISIKPVCLDIENGNSFLIVFIIIHVINAIKYVKNIIEYLIKFNKLDDMKDEKKYIIYEKSFIKNSIRQLENEIDNISEIVVLNDDNKAKEYIENSPGYLKLVNEEKKV